MVRCTNLLALLFLFFPGVSHTRSALPAQKPTYATLEKVIAEINKNSASSKQGFNWALRDLSRVYAMAYVTGDSQVPLARGDGMRPDYFQWVRSYLQTNGATELPLKIKMPVTPERLTYLERACGMISDLAKKSEYNSVEVAWCLIQQGKKSEAKALLAKIYDSEVERDEQIASDSPHNIIEVPLPGGAHDIGIALSGKPVLRVPLFSFKIHRLTQHVNLVDGISRRLANWGTLGDAYLKNPSNENFQALVAQIHKDLPSETSEVDIRVGSFGLTYSRASLEELLTKLHLQNIKGATFLQDNLKAALHTNNAAECSKLAGSATFAEGKFSLALVCATRLAWKEKNWGHCRELISNKSFDMESFPLCLSYLALRSGKEVLCAEVESYLKSSKESNAAFYGSRCRDAARGELTRGTGKIEKQPGTDFFSKSDWSEKNLPSSWGEASLGIRSGTTGKVSVEDIVLRETSINYAMKNSQRDRYTSFSLYEDAALRKDLATVTVLGPQNAKLASVDEKVTLLKSDESFGSPNPDFTLQKVIGDDGGLLSYYTAVLDPKEDAATIEKIRRKLWAAQERSKAQKKLEGFVD